MPEDHTATVYEVRTSRRDNVRLVIARCDRCEKDVMHGGGPAEGPLRLGGRVTHCGCSGEYLLRLADQIAGGYLTEEA